MAVVTSLIGWLVISTWKKLFNESYSSIISGSFIAGLLSVVFSSIAFVLEYAIGKSFDPTLNIGASKYSKKFSVIIEEISVKSVKLLI